MPSDYQHLFPPQLPGPFGTRPNPVDRLVAEAQARVRDEYVDRLKRQEVEHAERLENDHRHINHLTEELDDEIRKTQAFKEAMWLYQAEAERRDLIIRQLRTELAEYKGGTAWGDGVADYGIDPVDRDEPEEAEPGEDTVDAETTKIRFEQLEEQLAKAQRVIDEQKLTIALWKGVVQTMSGKITELGKITQLAAIPPAPIHDTRAAFEADHG